MLSGYKTYIVSVLSLAYAAFGFGMGWLDGAQTMQLTQVALVAMGLRSALS